MKKRIPLNEPFDFTIVINCSGITKSDGLYTLTPKMIIDKLTDPLERAVFEGTLRDYSVKVEINNIAEARKTLSKSRKRY